MSTTATCNCGCSTITSITKADEACRCGCKCCAPGALTREEEIAELERVRAAADQRLAELREG